MAGNGDPPVVHCADGGESTQADNAYRDHRDLKPLGRKEDVKKFLKDIQEAFVQKVDVEQSGLQDALSARGILSDSDTQSLYAIHHPTPKEKARRLWTILYTIDHKIFIERALPVLCTLYGFIIPEKYWKDGQSHASMAERYSHTDPKEPDACTHCAIRNRLRPADLADFLLKRGAISYPIYRHLTSNVRTSPPDWSTIFRSFERLHRFSVTRHAPDLARILREHALHVPDDLDLVDQMSRGFPCSCRKQEDKMLLSLRRPSADSNASEISSVFPHTEYSDDWSDGTSIASSADGMSVVSSRSDDASASVKRDGPIPPRSDLTPVLEEVAFLENSRDTDNPRSPTVLSGEPSGTTLPKDSSEDTATVRHVPSKLCPKHATFPRGFRETNAHQRTPATVVFSLPPPPTTKQSQTDETANRQPQTTTTSETASHTVRQTPSAGTSLEKIRTSAKSESDKRPRLVSTSSQTDVGFCPQCCLECDSVNFEMASPVPETTGCRL